MKLNRGKKTLGRSKMINLGKESKLNADQVLERAVKFFGEGEERCSQVMLTRL